MKRFILPGVAASLILFMASSQTSVVHAQDEVVDVDVVYRNPQRGVQVIVDPWDAEMWNGYHCTWNVSSAPGGPNQAVTIKSFWVRGGLGRGRITRPLANHDPLAGDDPTKKRRHGPFSLHPSCDQDPNCNGAQSTDVDPPLEAYEIIIDLVLPGGAEKRVVIDPDYRVRP